MYGELGYAAAYVHLFYVLSGVERYVDCFLCRLEGMWYCTTCLLTCTENS
jgi:hypothetical protein